MYDNDKDHIVSTGLDYMEALGKGYCLYLANGDVWRLVATPETSHILDKIANIMMLTECNTLISNTLIFTSHNINANFLADEFRDELKNFPGQGWISTTFGYVTVWQNPNVSIFIIDIIEKSEAITDLQHFVYVFMHALYPVYRKVFFSEGLPFHGALIEYDGRGYLLPANSGTGKSTCCRRIPLPWKAISDEEALVVSTGDGYFVHPWLTWSNLAEQRPKTSWDVQRYLPLAGIFFIEQSPYDEASSMRSVDAAQAIYNNSIQVYRRFYNATVPESLKSIRTRLFENTCALSNKVPSYRLRVSLTGEFWEAMRGAILENGGKQF